MRRWMIMALITLTAAPGIALAIGFGAGVRMGYRTEVAQLDNGVFEIVSYGTSAPVSYWCGAGDFAIRGLRTKGNQRIYVWKAYGPSVSKPGKKGVAVFPDRARGGRHQRKLFDHSQACRGKHVSRNRAKLLL